MVLDVRMFKKFLRIDASLLYSTQYRYMVIHRYRYGNSSIIKLIFILTLFCVVRECAFLIEKKNKMREKFKIFFAKGGLWAFSGESTWTFVLRGLVFYLE